MGSSVFDFFCMFIFHCFFLGGGITCGLEEDVEIYFSLFQGVQSLARFD